MRDKNGRRWSISLDYDGVLGKEDGYTCPMVEWDYSLITEALANGYAVSIVTCNLPRYIASELRKAGFDAFADEKMVHEWWDGGPNGTDIVVTNRKLHTDMHVDDRAFEHHYDQPTARVWSEFEVRQQRWLDKHNPPKRRRAIRTDGPEHDYDVVPGFSPVTYGDLRSKS